MRKAVRAYLTEKLYSQKVSDAWDKTWEKVQVKGNSLLKGAVSCAKALRWSYIVPSRTSEKAICAGY